MAATSSERRKTASTWRSHNAAAFEMRPRCLAWTPSEERGPATSPAQGGNAGEGRQCTRRFSGRVVASLGGKPEVGGGGRASGQGSAPALTAAAADVRHRRSAPGIPCVPLSPLFPCHAERRDAKGSRQRACEANFPARAARTAAAAAAEPARAASDGAFVAATTCDPPLIPSCICKWTLRGGKVPLP